MMTQIFAFHNFVNVDNKYYWHESLTLKLYRDMIFSLDKKLHNEWCSRKEERNGIAWLLPGIWQLKGVRRNTEKR
jgi:hypothetical protein